MTGAAAGGGGGSGSTRRAAVGKAGGRSRSAQPRAAGGGGGGSGGGSEEEEQRDGGSLFLVNKSGFPMDGQTWERMWGHVERVHPDGGAVAAAIRSAARLARPSVPPVPNYKLSMSIPEWLQAIQTYMKMLQYNHTGTQFFEIRKTRPLSGCPWSFVFLLPGQFSSELKNCLRLLMETAKEMTRESLPIKCLEAVILGIYLTNGQPSVERFPISFKTHFSGNYFHHVVLGIYCNGRYGSLGMSRRSDLMDKPLTYRTLSDLIFEFEDSYKKYLHSVKKVKIGLYVPHEPHSFQPIEWKQLVLNVSKMMRTEVRKELEKFARDMRMKILKPSSAHSPMKERSRGKSLSPRRRQASPQRRACRRDKSVGLLVSSALFPPLLAGLRWWTRKETWLRSMR
ncbi:tubulinyl-Tyr carboxypeptidase 2 isoform X1 [Buteo buteo]|uniref:tubulinyl-Tyr carboxypeptidase 2 isoform X1 n=1 Tax=Buteo buteo TaxID=30397 RepID=UPI003EC0E32D